MNIIKTSIAGLVVIEPKVFGDDRGFFMEVYNKQNWLAAGLPDVDFIQDNHSKSSKGVLRGMHFQSPFSQGKLVRVTRGAVFDVAVDLRIGSRTCGQWFGCELSASNKSQLWVPPGFAHGFLTLKDDTEFLYKCTDYYHPESEWCLKWDDDEIAIEWPEIEGEYKLSEKDKLGKNLSEVLDVLRGF